MLTDKVTHIRYLIVTMLFIASCFSYGDRVALSVGGVVMQKALALSPAKMGFLFSGFGVGVCCGASCLQAACWTGLGRSACMASAFWHGRFARC